VVVSYCVWLMTVSWRAIQLRKHAVAASASIVGTIVAQL
jgi:hypothetical protein